METLFDHLYVGRLSSEEKTMVYQLTKNMVKPGQILLTIKDQTFLKYVVEILFMENVECVSHYFYECEPQYVVEIFYQIACNTSHFCRLFKILKKNVQQKCDFVIHNV